MDALQQIDPHTRAHTRTAPVMSLHAQVVLQPSGRLAFIAGQAAAGTPATEARGCLQNLARAMASLGATPSDLVYLALHAPDNREADWLAAGTALYGDDWYYWLRAWRGRVAPAPTAWLDDRAVVGAMLASVADA